MISADINLSLAIRCALGVYLSCALNVQKKSTRPWMNESNSIMRTIEEKLVEIEYSNACETCGSCVHVEGGITKYYKSMTSELLAVIRVLIKQRNRYASDYDVTSFEQRKELDARDAELLKLFGDQ